MARPRKKARDLTTEQALKKLFPPEVRKKAKKEVKKADEQATKGKSKDS
jgi:hypothetical protein